MENSELYHYGIKGMKWGIRRYVNSDGSLTELGKKRQEKQHKKEIKKDVRALREQYRRARQATSDYDGAAALRAEVGEAPGWGVSKAEVMRKHDQAVDESRRTRQMEKDFINKWGKKVVSDVNKSIIDSGKDYASSHVFMMVENRKKYSEGAKGDFPYIFGPQDLMNDEPTDYERLIKG